jgi:hypothetical protein
MVVVEDERGQVLMRSGKRSGFSWLEWAKAIADLAHEAQYGVADNVFSDDWPSPYRVSTSARGVVGSESQWDFEALRQRLLAGVGPSTLPEMLLNRLGHATADQASADLVLRVYPTSAHRLHLDVELGRPDQRHRVYRGDLQAVDSVTDPEHQPPQVQVDLDFGFTTTP